MSKDKKKGMRYPVLVTLLLAGIFTFGAVTGMVLHATGEKVSTTAFMSMVSHTEYRYSESGQIIARLVDFQGLPVTVDNCTATILYPNKSFFVNQSLMTQSANISGDHYYNFTTPSGPEGVYEYQATCYYTVGINVRNASVTNSFHLSSAFNSLMDNDTYQNAQLLAIEGNLTNVQGNLTALSSQISSVNSTLSNQISNVSAQLASSYNNLTNQVNSNFSSLQTQLNNNVTQILDAIYNQTVNVNLTPVLDAISALNDSMAANFTFTNGLITTLSSDMNNNFSVAFNYLSSINTTSTNIYSVLLDVNATTTNTYQYLTGTVTTKLDDILTDLGVINATVNRIETNTVDINATVNTILDNQQTQVHMDVFSG